MYVWTCRAFIPKLGYYSTNRALATLHERILVEVKKQHLENKDTGKGSDMKMTGVKALFCLEFVSNLSG